MCLHKVGFFRVINELNDFIVFIDRPEIKCLKLLSGNTYFVGLWSLQNVDQSKRALDMPLVR